jgi:cyclase
MGAEFTLRASRHFSVQPLAEGVFALIAASGGAAVGNAGIIDLGGLCLVFDTFQTPGAAEELLQSVKALVGYGPDFVINSHYHNDHVWGNQAFPPAVHILASTRTYQLLLTAGKKELEEESANAAQSLAYFREQFQMAKDETQKKDAELLLCAYEGLVQDLPRISVRLPDILYEGCMSFHGAKRTAELIAYAQCHTGNDAVLFLPEAGIIFMSDLLFVGFHPYLGDGDPVNLVKTLRKIQELKATTFIPGHGQVGTAADVDQLIEYIETCIETAQVLVKDGKAEQEIINSMPIPEQYSRWQLRMFYQSNLRALCKWLTG